MKQDLHFTYQHVPGKGMLTSALVFTERIKEIALKKTGLYETPEHALRLPLDQQIENEVVLRAREYWNTGLRYVIVVGIGGSNLGAKAVYDALRGTQDGVGDDYPKLIFADTVSPKLLADIVHLLETRVHYKEELVINLISKSGTTTESIANFELLYAALIRRFPDIASRIVVTTDRGSKLWVRAEKEHIGLLFIPELVGGRFSVFSAVGLFPLALAGVDISALLAGARDVLTSCLEKENHALHSAEAIYRAHHHGATMLNFFFFNPELESLGKWARQLYGESLGKEKDRSGNIVHAGITPIVSIGSTDLHSVAQLYLGGPRDKMTLFCYIHEHSSLRLPEQGLFLDLVPGLPKKTPGQIMRAIHDGVKAAYIMHKLPYGEVVLPAISPYALGMFLEWQMLTVMYLGELFKVNTFDQPNVEDYKKTTRELLEKE